MGTYQTNHLDASSIKLILEFCKGSKLSCAHGGKVGRMTEQDSPLVVQEFVKVLIEVSVLSAAHSLEIFTMSP
jgi:hypothetical protein